MAANAPGRPLVIGLTGGIGSGKSAVADAFAALGVAVTDTDRIAHELTAPGAAGTEAIRAAFGAGVFTPDGALDRSALRHVVFADAAQRARLEALLHPLIGAAARSEIGGWRSSYGLLVVPLLLERGGLRTLADRVLVVDCTEDQQRLRVMARSGMGAAEVQAIMAAQASRDARLAVADDIIDNNGPRDRLAVQVAALDERYRRLAANRGAGCPPRMTP